jgi:hypothetical protein
MSTVYESTIQREINLNRKVHMNELNLNIGLDICDGLVNIHDS